jgi:hypothetical protein
MSPSEISPGALVPSGCEVWICGIRWPLREDCFALNVPKRSRMVTKAYYFMVYELLDNRVAL